MGKLSCVIAVFLGFCFIPALALADENFQPYEIPEIPLKFSLPGRMPAATRAEVMSGQVDGEFLELSGGDRDFVKKVFLRNNYYLQAFERNKTYRLAVAVMEDAESRRVWDFWQLSEVRIKAMSEPLRKFYKASIKAGREGRFSDSGVTFLIQNTEKEGSDGRTTYGRRYFTIYNGLAIDVSFSSNEPLNDESRALLFKVVQGLGLPAKRGLPARKSSGTVTK